MKLLYFFLLAVLPSVIFAQSNYHSGYVLKNNGDTLKGFINYREWEENPLSIDFKLNKDDKQKLEFNPVTIKGFQITGMETYISYIGMISMNPTSLSKIPEKLDTSRVLDNIFLKQVATGKHLTLLYHNDKIKTRFFIAEPNTDPVELKYYVYYQDESNITDRDLYKGQILFYINKFEPENSKLISNVDRLGYTETDLESITNKINNVVALKQTASSRLFISLGVNSTVTEVYNVNSSGLVQDYTTVFPKISFGIDIFNNPNVQRLVFRTELSFSYVNPKYSFPLVANEVNANGSDANETYQFKQYTASITPQILFNIYNKDKLKVYLDAGLAFNFSAYADDKLVIPNNSITEKTPYTLEAFWSNFPVQAGVTINKKIEICFTYAGYVAFTKYSGFYASNQTTSLGLKYLFGKN